ncbi:hypothetical protein [Subtercola boreus]|uniref:hypothetical protein n=1 Tax=Subtercola boreus TaxID=120213 RepID=UPI0015594B8D|nr:hypothetical protein [Subtercola boreus]
MDRYASGLALATFVGDGLALPLSFVRRVCASFGAGEVDVGFVCDHGRAQVFQAALR